MKSSAGRIVAILAIVAVAVFLVMFVGGDDEYQITAEFQNASQLVPGNQVMVGGLAAGSVKEIGLGEDGEAEVQITVSDDYAPLPEGTTATIRQGSLSSVAGRQVQLTLPPDGSDTQGEIEDGGTMTQAETVSAVDLDQIFNTLDVKTVKDFKEVITGFRDSYEGVTKQANEGARYFNPLLSTSRRVFGELNRNPENLESPDRRHRVALGTSRRASRRPERTRLQRLERPGGDRAPAPSSRGRHQPASRLPAAGQHDLREPALHARRRRSARRRVDPGRRPTRPVLRGVPGSSRRRSADDPRPRRDRAPPGKANDLVELTRLQVPLAEAGVGTGAPNCGDPTSNDYDPPAADEDFTQGSLGEANCALRNSNEQLATLRAYTPELVGWFDDFSTSGLFDASGALGRINSTFNAFSPAVGNGLPDLLSPIDPADVLSGTGALDIDNDQRCPGSSERDPGDGSTPFTDGGALDCDPTQVPQGP